MNLLKIQQNAVSVIPTFPLVSHSGVHTGYETRILPVYTEDDKLLVAY